MVKRALVAVLLAEGIGHADLLNHELLRKHVDEQLAAGPVEELGRGALVAGTLIPIFGTYRIERRVFGGLRMVPAASRCAPSDVSPNCHA